ncbi:MAG: GNAT family N-acetyltransferase [Burkholderiales bacterium]|nr:GNAT family N-acetyltransferase [Burkholderiales bacterium]
MRIARLQASDLDRYRALMLHAYASAPDAFTSTPDERAAAPLSWWAARIADGQGLSQALGAFVDDGLVGTVTVEFSAKPKTRHKAHLIGMFTHEASRGRGIGRALVHAALQEAGARPGVQVVTLTVTEGNALAVRLYQSFGFQAFGVEPMAIQTPAGFLSKVHMWLRLPNATPRDLDYGSGYGV